VAAARGFATVDFAADAAAAKVKAPPVKTKTKKLKAAPGASSNRESTRGEASGGSDRVSHFTEAPSDGDSDHVDNGGVGKEPTMASAAEVLAASGGAGARSGNGGHGSLTAGASSSRRPEALDPKRGFVSVAKQPRALKGTATAGLRAALPVWEAEDGGPGAPRTAQEVAEAKRQQFVGSGPRAADPKRAQRSEGLGKQPRYDYWDALLDAGKSKKVGKAARKRAAAEAAVEAQARGENPFERAGQVKAKAAKKLAAEELSAAKAAAKHSADI
jgi:hypothetical protein